MQPDPRGVGFPLLEQGDGQKPGSEAAALGFGYQTKILQFDVWKFAPVELAKSERLPLNIAQYIDIERTAGEQGRKLAFRHQESLIPSPGFAHPPV